MVREKAPGLETWVIFTPASGNKTSSGRAVDIAALFYFTDRPRRTCDQDWRAGLLDGCPILAAGEGGLAVLRDCHFEVRGCLPGRGISPILGQLFEPQRGFSFAPA